MVDLAGRPCLVVGGGAVATRKVLGLLASEAAVTVVSPDLSAPLAELADIGRLRWRAEPYATLGTPEGASAWVLVVAATDDDSVNGRVAADAEATGTWVNVASRPDGGAVAIPARWQHGAVTVAVSTDGVHPGAARWLCDEAVAAIGDAPLIALDLLDQVRRDDATGGGPGRRPDWRSAVDSGMLELIRAGQLAEAKERLEACLSSSSD